MWCNCDHSQLKLARQVPLRAPSPQPRGLAALRPPPDTLSPGAPGPRLSAHPSRHAQPQPAPLQAESHQLSPTTASRRGRSAPPPEGLSRSSCQVSSLRPFLTRQLSAIDVSILLAAFNTARRRQRIMSGVATQGVWPPRPFSREKLKGFTSVRQSLRREFDILRQGPGSSRSDLGNHFPLSGFHHLAIGPNDPPSVTCFTLSAAIYPAWPPMHLASARGNGGRAPLTPACCRVPGR